MHLLVALLEDREGIVAPVLEKVGAGPQTILAQANQVLEELPRVSGGAAQPGLSTTAQRLLDQAFKEADNFKDEYVSTEHLLLSLADQKYEPAGSLLNRQGANHEEILKALVAVRGTQRVTD